MVETNVSGLSVPNALKVDRLIVSMDFGLESIVYHFHPTQSNSQVILFHHGHVGEMDTETISSFLRNGYSVVSFSMPYDQEYGVSQPSMNPPSAQRPATHAGYARLQPERGHAVRYFIEPVIVSLNYVADRYEYDAVSMVGLSGGGWTTTVAAAVDTRIGSSFPVAGSYPGYLREYAPASTVGDWEQSAGLFETASYLDLYLLAAEGRRQLQIINRYDPCCFGGTVWRRYRDSVQARLGRVGPGVFDVFMDESHHEHIISRPALTRILSELSRHGSRGSGK